MKYENNFLYCFVFNEANPVAIAYSYMSFPQLSIVKSRLMKC